MTNVKVTMLYSERAGRCREVTGGWGFGILDAMGDEIRLLVARTFSTRRIPLEDRDVDWIPVKVDAAAHVPAVILEIEVVGRKALYEKLSTDTVDQFKKDILAIDSIRKIPAGQMSIRIKFLSLGCLEL